MQLSSSSLCGTEVQNHSGDNLGKIEDLMLNTTTGEVDYAVVSFGGFLGVGNKLFAVPLQAFSVDRNDEKLVLSESKERLENAPGFDKDQWPMAPNPEWNQTVRAYYNV